MTLTQLVPATAVLTDNGLSFEESDGLPRTLAHGLLYVRYPQSCDFDPGVKFARSYYLDADPGDADPFRGYRVRPLDGTQLGYSDPSADQVELFQLELPLWRRYLPPELATLLHNMNDVAKHVLFAICDAVGVREEHHDQIALGVSKDEALQYCIFNHYRRVRSSSVGFTAHKDSGFITVLYTTEAGLETLEDDRWLDVVPRPRHFTVVLGHSLEVLTANLARPARASYHRVRSGQGDAPDRFSFGVYVGPHFEQDLYQYDCQGNLDVHMSFLDFQKIKAEEMQFEFHPKLSVAAGAGLG